MRVTGRRILLCATLAVIAALAAPVAFLVAGWLPARRDGGKQARV